MSTAKAAATNLVKTADDPDLAFSQEELDQDVGAGVSTDARDNLVPLLTIIQKLSPQLSKSRPQYIPDAKAGDIYLKLMDNPLVDGEEGVLFQPCWFYLQYVEWTPIDQGGGWKGTYDALPKEASKDTGGKRVRWRMPNGTEIIETRYYAGLVYRDGISYPYVIPFSSTGHTVAKQWMSKIGGIRRADKKPAPFWYYIWRLKTKEQSNAAGTWFAWDINPERKVSTEEYQIGKQLNDAFRAKRLAPAQERTSSDESDTPF